MLLFGSRAAKIWYNDFRECNRDWDYIVDKNDNLKSNKRFEYHKIPIDLEYYNFNNVVIPNALYTFKVSHIFWDIKWTKTINDIQFYQKKKCVIIEPLLIELFEYWTSIHNERKLDLDLSYSKSKFDECYSEITKLSNMFKDTDPNKSNVWYHIQSCKHIVLNYDNWMPIFIIKNWSKINRPPKLEKK